MAVDAGSSAHDLRACVACGVARPAVGALVEVGAGPVAAQGDGQGSNL